MRCTSPLPITSQSLGEVRMQLTPKCDTLVSHPTIPMMELVAIASLQSDKPISTGDSSYRMYHAVRQHFVRVEVALWDGRDQATLQGCRLPNNFATNETYDKHSTKTRARILKSLLNLTDIARKTRLLPSMENDVTDAKLAVCLTARSCPSVLVIPA